MVYCMAVECSNGSNFGGSFHVFPKNKKMWKAWGERLNREGFNPDEYYQPMLCSEHFTPDSFERHLEIARACGMQVWLKKGAIPSLFSWKRKREDASEETPPKRRLSSALAKRQNLQLIGKQKRATTPTLNTDASEQQETATDTSDLAYTSTDLGSVPSAPQFLDAQCQANIVVKAKKNRCYSRSFQTDIKMDDMQEREDKIEDLERQVTDLKERVKELEAVLNNIEDKKEKKEEEEEEEEEEDVDGEDWSTPGSKQQNPDWQVEQEDPDSSDSEDEDYCNTDENEREEEFGNGERKFVVDVSCLKELLEQCSRCSAPCSVVITRKVGCGITLKQQCPCGYTKHWDSQPAAPGKYSWMPVGNITLSCGIFFSGASPVKALNALRNIGIACISLRTYFRIQKFYLISAVVHVWRTNQADLFKQLYVQEAYLGGDARCCSSGHTAKYGSYSVMDLKLGKVVDCQLVQVNEVKNSCAMELEGLVCSLKKMEEEHIEVIEITTDRHASVKKFMREVHPEIHHWFDVWHCAKGVYKKLETLSKKKGCAGILEWAHNISNHLYWCAATSEGDGDLLLAKWLSCLNHMCDQHVDHDSAVYPACTHPPMDSDIDWMIRGSKLHKELAAIVNSPYLKKDVKKLSPEYQTSCLESFHKIIINFTPKALHFFYPSMQARLFLAYLHWNENSGRPQARKKDGTLQYSVSFPKAKRGIPTVKPVTGSCTYGYVQDLIKEVLDLRTRFPSYKLAKQQLAEPVILPVPSTYEKPEKAKLVREHHSRFNRT